MLMCLIETVRPLVSGKAAGGLWGIREDHAGELGPELLAARAQGVTWPRRGCCHCAPLLGSDAVVCPD